MDARTKVFISYSHRDREWLDRLQVHLTPLERDGVVDRWDDRKIRAGERWKEVIQSALASAQVAVLLVSADFLASDFIESDELPAILEAEERRGLVVIPVIVKPSRFARTKTLSRFQALNPPERPVLGMSENDQEALWVKLTEEIETARQRAEAPRPEPARRDRDLISGREGSPPSTCASGAIPTSPASNLVFDIFDPERSLSIPLEVRIETADALEQAGDPRLDPWVSVPAGRFLMGAQKADPSAPRHDPEASDNEAPVHEVRLRAYQIGRYPITVRDFKRFVEADGYTDTRWWQAGEFGQQEMPEGWENQLSHPNRPVVGVSWFEAAAYCRWAGHRLPTEAQWERAARGTAGRRFPWGSEQAEPERLNYEGGIGHATPVGIYPLGATPDGIHDMAGNVWEWCQDWYAEDWYTKSPTMNPSGPSSGDRRVLRGGSWYGTARYARSADRDGVLRPGLRDDLVGFRVVRAGGVRTS